VSALFDGVAITLFDGSRSGSGAQLKDTKRELLFVTLDKSGKSFSPTTR
jgi:hypothetical protein